MKVLILTEGGQKIGFGHLTRCLGLAQGFKAYQDIQEIKFLVYGDAFAKQFLKQCPYECVFFNWLKNTNDALKLVIQNDYTVIDSYLAKKSFYEMVSRLKKSCLLMIDDYKRISYPGGVLVNPSLAGEKLLCKRS